MTDPAPRTPARPALAFPIEKAPEHGQPLEVAPGVHWLRMPLPFVLNHINLWLLEDGDGWTAVDTGLNSADTRGHWEAAFTGIMGGRPLNRVIVTHMHPDHVGLAGWLTRRFDVPLVMTRTEYIMCRMLVHDTGRDAPPDGVRFYKAAGFTDEQIAAYKKRFGGFGKGVDQMPDSYHRLQNGDTLTIGGRDWHVVTGGGHSPEHASLYCPDLKVFISGDQVLPGISSNVSVWPTEPDGDPLSEWLEACERIKHTVPDDVLVCPAHQRVFRNLHARCDALIEEHETNLAQLFNMLAEPKRSVDVFPALFRREITGDLIGMATGESIAHLNCLIARGLARRERDQNGVDYYTRA